MRYQEEFNVIIRTNSLEGQRDHFISRLKDRYEMTITNDEYNELCNPKGVFHGVFKKNREKTVGWVMIKGVKVWVLRDGELNRLATCYPPSVENSNVEMIRACLGGRVLAAAITILQLYTRESLRVMKMKFSTVKEAALYIFSKTHFPTLHIDKYKYGEVRTVKVASCIDKILSGKSEYVQISLKKKLNSGQNPERSDATEADSSTNAGQTNRIKK